jgi:hypothetical protein
MTISAHPAYNLYWIIWCSAFLASFLVVEIFALATGGLSLSEWVWLHLHIVRKETIGQWSAADLLLFLTYISVFVLWLPAHFWFHKFT